MKLITWNCQGAFRKKAHVILEHKPDILIVQECECPDKLVYKPAGPQPSQIHWHGENPNKGIGILSYSNYKFEVLNDFNPAFRYVIPLQVTGNGQSFLLFAIWAMPSKTNPHERYIGQIWLAIQHYSALLAMPAILIGDFNSNKVWDKKWRVANHTDVVNKLAEKNIHSIYHRHFDEEQGKEKLPTLFLQKKQNKPYHIDYCFASLSIAEKVKQVEVGSYDEWITHSDHSPLKITFEF